MATKKSSEYQNFENLTKQLLAVPKKQLDKAVDQYNARKEARKKKLNNRG